MLPVHPKPLLIDKFSQPCASFNSWFKIHCFISCTKERSASFINRGLLTGLGSRCASVRLQIIGISWSPFPFYLSSHLSCLSIFPVGVLANTSLVFSTPFGMWFLLLFLKQLQPLTCPPPACHLLLLSSCTHSTA